MKIRSQLIVTIILLSFITTKISAQDNYLLDSLFGRSVVPAFGVEDSVYYQYDESNRIIKESNKYFYKVYTYSDDIETVSFYDAASNTLTGEKQFISALNNNSGYEAVVSASFENGIEIISSFDTTFIENNLPVKRAYWQSLANENKIKLFEENSVFLDGNLVSSISSSFSDDTTLLRQETYTAGYDGQDIQWEANAISNTYSVSTMDSTLYIYVDENTLVTIQKSYRNNALSYCVTNKTIVSDDLQIRNSYESHNCVDFSIRDSVVGYFSDFSIIEFDSTKSYRFIDDQAIQYRFELNTLYFDEELATIEVFYEHFFSNRKDGVVTEINSSNSFYSLAQTIETASAPSEIEWMMYPNPAYSNEGILLEMRNIDQTKDPLIRIFDLQGELVDEFKPNNAIIEIPALRKSGMYFIQLLDEKGKTFETRKLMVH